MLTSFLTVFEKVFVLFIMIFIGYLCGKTGMITKRGAQQITSILLYVVTPCLIIASLQSIIGDIGITALISATFWSAVSMGAAIFVSMLFFRKSPNNQKKILRFGAVYSNSGFMGIPLVEAVFGSTGVAYASMYNAAFNFLMWTHGYASVSEKRSPGVKQILTNPGIIGLAVGFPLFAFSLQLPEILKFPIDSMASMNTPLAMMVVGIYISGINLKELFTSRSLYLLSALRLVVLPGLTLLLFLPFGIDKTIASTILLLSSAPAATATAMFAVQFGGDAKLASKAVALTTLLSAATMPVFCALAKEIF
ncbi:AEC family transporter [Caproiciproducens faecalis]|uniref:AEC family transporter n=1 Tax=Caproiciproducens faecalis TaxID=2820301 RepID=A0ABS7DRC7_9FIRM|nr:AEC family transporter [Caproiciproducens faecalis]MBW7573859.1 AEC family transporter [Caproiciproducens faecalis]